MSGETTAALGSAAIFAVAYARVLVVNHRLRLRLRAARRLLPACAELELPAWMPGERGR